MNSGNLKKWAIVLGTSFALYLVWRNLENRIGIVRRLTGAA
jgi:hypothetical protein